MEEGIGDIMKTALASQFFGEVCVSTVGERIHQFTVCLKREKSIVIHENNRRRLQAEFYESDSSSVS